MPSLKPVVRIKRERSDHTSLIYIRVVHNRKVRYIATTYYIEARFMGSDGRITSRYPGQAKLNGALILLLQQYNDIIADAGPDIVYMDINSLISKLKAQKEYGSDFMAYMKLRIVDLKKENRFSYAESYQVTINHLEGYTHKKELDFKEITVSFLRDFEGHLRQSYNARVNTCRIYLNNIRAVFFYAIDNDIIKADFSPFRKFKIKQEKTRKRAITIEDLRTLLKIRSLVTKKQQVAIDIFFLMFYLLGINLKDLLFLKPESLYQGRIFFSRFKTGRNYSVKVFPQAQEIIARYRGEKYLLCFMEEKEKISPGRLPEAQHDILSQLNKLMRTVVKRKELKFKVTTYTMRHSWATIASSMGISRDIISHALGHGIDTMTDTYIDFDLDKVDRANRRVINAISLETAAYRRGK